MPLKSSWVSWNKIKLGGEMKFFTSNSISKNNFTENPLVLNKINMNKIKSIIKISFVFLTIIFLASVTNRDAKNIINYVDPFIGSGGHGHVFVGANVPFGGVQVGPTNFNKGWDWSSLIITLTVLSKAFAT